MRSWSLLMVLCAMACETGLVDTKPPTEVCDNLVDDDEDGLLDCLDPDCATSCGEINCTDGLDNDENGLTDCSDPFCDGACPEQCDDTRDNDGDGLIDCEDIDCIGSCPEVCSDGLDNDGDGFVDCLDEDCSDPSCPESCVDGWDNDADGLIDCDDPDCNNPTCPEICDDGIDNDGDSRADCDDSDCDGDCPEICNDFRDNDADGLIDCLDDECTPECDADGDGFYGEAYGGDDCDDTRFEVNPRRPEICNGEEELDDDCNGLVDEEDPGIDALTLIGWYPDGDADGHGNNTEVQFACQQPEGWAAGNLDCDDSLPEVNPDMPEICNPDEPRDDDCDGLVDDDDPDVTEDSWLDWYEDLDGDGYGREGVPFGACSAPDGYAANDDDCDDTDPTQGPPSLWYPDLDGDRWGAGDPFSYDLTCDPPAEGHAPDWRGLDCDDTAPMTYPGAEEICEDGIDQDCDGRDVSCIQIYVADGRNIGGMLYGVNIDTGLVLELARTPAAITGLSFSPSGDLYAVSGGGFAATSIVYRVDLETYVFTEVMESAMFSWSGFSWNYGDGELYMWTEDGDQMHHVDLASGTETSIYSASSYDHCMASDASGQMYRLTGATVYEIDHVAGRETLLGTIAGLPADTGGHGCAFLDGLLYTAPNDYFGGGVRELWAVDLTTMSSTSTGITLSENLDALGANSP